MATSHITDFIQSLSSEEIKIVSEYLNKSKNIKSYSDENKMDKLFNIIIKEPNRQFDDKELSNLIGSNDGALRVLKSRLFEKTQEALVLNKHFDNEMIFNVRQRIVFTLKKKILLIKSLNITQNQKRIETINLLMTETIKSAKTYEAYDILIETLYFQKYLNGIRLGVNEFERINEEIAFYEHCLKCVQNALDAFYRTTLNHNYINSMSSDKFCQYLRTTIKQMKIDYKTTKAQEINYYMHFLQIALFEREKNYKQALIYCKRILILLKKSIVLHTTDRIGFVMSNLSQFNVYTENYKEAVNIARAAQKYHVSGSFNSITLKEQEVLAYLYSRDFKEALTGIKELVSHSLFDTGNFRRSRFNCYEAHILFATKKYKESIQLLNKSLEIEKDKGGWNIAIRFLIIMTFIELNKFSEARTSITTLRKHIERTGKTQEIKQRDI